MGDSALPSSRLFPGEKQEEAKIDGMAELAVTR